MGGGIKYVEVAVGSSRLPADSVVIHIRLERPITKLSELDELGLDFIDRPKTVTVEQLIKLIEKLKGV